MPDLLYIIGPPGVGKTTLLDSAIPGGAERSDPLAHRRLPGGLVLGRRRERFGGTDALPLNVLPKVLRWLLEERPPLVAAEGDRLACDRFFAALSAARWKVTVCFLWAPNPILAERRLARGSTQNAAWVRGRDTKSRRLAARWGAPGWILDGRLPVEELADHLRQHPVVSGLTTGGNPMQPVDLMRADG